MFEFYFVEIDQGTPAQNVAVYALSWSMLSFFLGIAVQPVLQRITKRRAALKAIQGIEDEILLLQGSIDLQKQAVERFASELRSELHEPKNLEVLQELAMDRISRFDRSLIVYGYEVKTRDPVKALQRATAVFTFCDIVTSGHARLKTTIASLDDQAAKCHDDFKTAMRHLTMEIYQTMNTFEREEASALDPFVQGVASAYDEIKKQPGESVQSFSARFLDPLLKHLSDHKRQSHVERLTEPTLRALELAADMKHIRERYASRLEDIMTNMLGQYARIRPRILEVRG